MVYCLIGAGIFWKLERPNEIRVCDEHISSLHEIHVDYNYTFNASKKEYVMSEDVYNIIFEKLVSINDIDILGTGIGRQYNESLPANAPENRIFDETTDEWHDYMMSTCETVWTFENAVYFCFTVISTIGYGNIAPATTAGRVFFIFYCIPGIGIFGILLARIQAVFVHSIEAGKVKYSPKSLYGSKSS